MSELKLKQGLVIRGDSLSCPLAFALDTYGNCLIDCHHCFFRRLNRTWGQDLKPLDVELFRKQMENGLKNEHPKSMLAWAIRNRKTLRFGNRTDPFQWVEREHKVSGQALEILAELKWSVVIQTRFTSVLLDYLPTLEKMIPNITIMPVISPGLEDDWICFEKKSPTPPLERLKHLKFFQSIGMNVGVNGEPFIPGYHTLEQFEEVLMILKAYGIKSYNTYNLHLNDFVAKRLDAIGVDIEKIWYSNRDEVWKGILKELIALAKKYDIILGCPDFINSGNFIEDANTCCGVTVPNPCTFNMRTWKKLLLTTGKSKEEILTETWDGVGNFDEGKKAMLGGFENERFTMKDVMKLDEKGGLVF